MTKKFRSVVVVVLSLLVLSSTLTTVSAQEVEDNSNSVELTQQDKTVPKSSDQKQVSILSVGDKLDTCSGYTVDVISGHNTFQTQNCYANYSEAFQRMQTIGQTNSTAVIRHKSSNGSLKIVAAYEGVAYSFPTHLPSNKRTDEFKRVSETVTIYKNSNLSNTTGVYLSDGYPLEYYGTDNIASENPKNFTALVSVQGAKGYIDIEAVDIIPMVYVTSGWQVNGYTVSSVYQSKGNYKDGINSKLFNPVQTSYIVENKGSYKEMSIEFRQAGGSIANYPIAVVPKNVPDGRYYSPDGVKLFKDRYFKNVLTIDGKDYENIVYFRDLYLRTKTNITGAELDTYMKKVLGSNYNESALKDMGQAFVDAQEKFGINALLIYAIAINESGNGLSAIAKNKNNIFGINAVDSNPDDAFSFESVKQNVEYMMGAFLTPNYIDIQWEYYGSQIGTKSSGIGTRYASDPFWNVKAVNHAYTIDKFLNFKDYNKLSLAKLISNQVIVYKTPNDSASVSTNILYNYRNASTNDISVTILGESGNFYLIHSTTPVGGDGNLLYPKTGAYTNYSWNASVAYVKKTDLRLLSTSEIPVVPDVVEVGEEKKYIVFDGPLNVRDMPNTSGNRLGEIETNTIVLGKLMSNGWIKITFDKKIGYVSGDFVREHTVSTISGDANGDSIVDLRDVLATYKHYKNIQKIDERYISNIDFDQTGVIDLRTVLRVYKLYKGL